MELKLRMTGQQNIFIKSHVMAGDGKEAGTLLLCEPVLRSDQIILLVKEIINIPYDKCTERTPSYLSWPTEQFLLPLYEKLERDGLSLIMLHSHPNGYNDFSSVDTENDRNILTRLNASIEGEQPHGSAIMLPDGKIKARILVNDNFKEFSSIAVAGDDICFYLNSKADLNVTDYIHKTAQVYGSVTTNILRNLKIGVVGCSGTGSPLIELLLRYHVGELVLIDFDKIDLGNLNRLFASRLIDAENGTLKVERLSEWIKETGLPTKVTIIKNKVPSEETTKALSGCDIVFGCVDNIVTRHAINKIACAYLIPYFDLGVTIKGNSKKPGELRQVIARCHYVQPDKSSLLDRGAITAERLAEENYLRDEPEFYQKLKELGYTNEPDDIQAVMVLTMKAAVMAVDDLMARLNSYRVDPNAEFDEQEHSFTHGYYEHRAHSTVNKSLRLYVAAGDKHVRF